MLRTLRQLFLKRPEKKLRNTLKHCDSLKFAWAKVRVRLKSERICLQFRHLQQLSSKHTMINLIARSSSFIDRHSKAFILKKLVEDGSVKVMRHDCQANEDRLRDGC